MNKQEQNYETFLTLIKNEDVEFVNKMHDTMLHDNYSFKVDHKSTVSIVTYTNKNTKKVLVKTTLKQGVLSVKIVGHNVINYESFIDKLPNTMIDAIQNSRDCRQLIDPNACWQACEMGSIFNLKGKELKKCRYHCFSFDVDSQNKIEINAFLDMERRYQYI